MASALKHIGQVDSHHGLRPREYQQGDGYFAAKLSIKVQRQNQDKLMNAFDYLMIFPARADKIFCAMLDTMKGLLSMNVLPLEGANLGHWYVEN